MNNKMNLLKKTSAILIGSLLVTGCSSFGTSMRNLLMGKSAEDSAPKVSSKSFNNQANLPPEKPRNYRRVTKDTFNQGEQLEEGAGSLWVMEGQGAYLFSQNIVRMIGDPLKVAIDGEAKAQLSSKVSTIKSLIDRLEQRRQQQSRQLASTQAPAAAGGDQANKAQGAAQPGAQAQGAQSAAPAADLELAVKSVSTRIVERLADGSYRVRGSQPFMIGSREYKVIVTGLVRAEDFSDEGIASDQLLDPTFDVVAERKRESL
jgi:flagellar L-ring protein precursor FlgH